MSLQRGGDDYPSKWYDDSDATPEVMEGWRRNSLEQSKEFVAHPRASGLGTFDWDIEGNAPTPNDIEGRAAVYRAHLANADFYAQRAQHKRMLSQSQFGAMLN